jgi:hypothetical protein
MVPRLVFVTWRATEVGGSSWPMLTGTLGLRMTL